MEIWQNRSSEKNEDRASTDTLTFLYVLSPFTCVGNFFCLCIWRAKDFFGCVLLPVCRHLSAYMIWQTFVSSFPCCCKMQGLVLNPPMCMCVCMCVCSYMWLVQGWRIMVAEGNWFSVFVGVCVCVCYGRCPPLFSSLPFSHLFSFFSPLSIQCPCSPPAPLPLKPQPPPPETGCPHLVTISDIQYVWLRIIPCVSIVLSVKCFID